MRNNDQQLLIGQCPKSVFAPNGVWRVRGIRDALSSVAMWLVKHPKIPPTQLRLQTQVACGSCLLCLFGCVYVSLYDI